MMANPPAFHPFQIILREHAKYMVAIKDLQNQVQALQQFRSRVLVSFPHLESDPNYGTSVAAPTKTMVQSPVVVSSARTVGRNRPNVSLPVRKAGTPGGKGSAGNRVLHYVQTASPSSRTGEPQLPKKHSENHGATSTVRPMRPSRSDRNKWRSADNDSKKFVVVAQGKNWMRIRPFLIDKSESDMEDSDDEDEHNISTSDSLHSMTEQPTLVQSKRKGKMTTVTCGNRKSEGNGGMGPRQDSGFSTDGKEKHTPDNTSSDGVRWSKQHTPSVGATASSSGSTEEDELMDVLERIGQTGKVLRVRAENAEKKWQEVAGGTLLSDIGLKADDLLTETERLRMEKEQLLDRLMVVEAENAVYRNEMDRMKELLVETEATRRALEERLEIVFSERERLGTRIHHLHSRFARNGISRDSYSAPKRLDSGAIAVSDSIMGGGHDMQPSRHASATTAGNSGKLDLQSPPFIFEGPSSLPDRLVRAKLKVRMDRGKISAILRETRVLELQRQLLLAVLGNEVLKSQLQQYFTQWNQRAANWQEQEANVQADLEFVRREHAHLQSSLKETESELSAERSKRKVLERALQAAYKDLTNANSDRADTNFSAEAVRQMSVEVFPVHHMAMNTASEKYLESGSSVQQPWKPMSSAVSNSSCPPTAAMDCNSCFKSHSHVGARNANQCLSYSSAGKPRRQLPACEGPSCEHGTAPGRHPATWQQCNDSLVGAEEDDDTLSKLCSRMHEQVRPLGNHSSKIRSRSCAKSGFNAATRRLSLNELSPVTKREQQAMQNEMKFIPRSYLNGSSTSPKNILQQQDFTPPKFSQSAEDLRHSEWTYDTRDSTTTSTNVSNLSRRPLAISEGAATCSVEN